VEDPLSDGVNQPALLGDADESAGGDQPERGVPPADERFEPNAAPGPIDLRLVK
jgi:hypothetical protein